MLTLLSRIVDSDINVIDINFDIVDKFTPSTFEVRRDLLKSPISGDDLRRMR